MTTPTLPPLPHDRVEAIETAVFGRIADERDRRRRRRRGIWTGAAAAAAVVVVAAIVGPSLGVTSGAGSSGSAIGAESAGDPGSRDLSAGGAATVPEAPDAGGSGSAGASSTEQGAAASGAADATAGRDVVASGSSTVEVDDPRAAISAIGTAAAEVGGYVESSQIGGGGVVMPIDGVSSNVPTSAGWITVRVPAASLTQVMDGLSAVGEVTATSVSRSDVTEQTVDLRARVAAGEASVARLTELLGQATSVGDLVAAESALADRQAQLDSDRQVLQSIESQVALSSLSVQLTARSSTVAADPAGFGDGLVAGWNGLVATLNAVVVGLGFLLPWIAVAGAAWAIVWGVRRAFRRRRAAREG